MTEEEIPEEEPEDVPEQPGDGDPDLPQPKTDEPEE